MISPGFRASYSRVALFLACPQAYEFRYGQRLPETSDTALGFGKAGHRGPEVTVREHVEAERVGPLSVDRAIAGFNESWFQEGLGDPALYAEGLAMMQGFVADQGVLDHRNVLAIEKPFQIQVGPYAFVGIFDRVDVVDGRTIRIIDYKTNQRLFTAGELDDHLQLSLYAAAARQLWPWVEHVELCLWMLRHRVRQETTRTRAQETAALALVEATCEAIARATAFPARLSSRCAWCGYRPHCATYAAALASTPVVSDPRTADAGELVAERAHLVTVGGLVEKRRKQVESALMAHLDQVSEIETSDVRLRIYNAESYDFPFAATVDELARQTGWTRDEVMARIATVDKRALSKLIRERGKTHGAPRAALLEADLQALATITTTPRLWATPTSR